MESTAAVYLTWQDQNPQLWWCCCHRRDSCGQRGPCEGTGGTRETSWHYTLEHTCLAASQAGSTGWTCDDAGTAARLLTYGQTGDISQHTDGQTSLNTESQTSLNTETVRHLSTQTDISQHTDSQTSLNTNMLMATFMQLHWYLLHCLSVENLQGILNNN